MPMLTIGWVTLFEELNPQTGLFETTCTDKRTGHQVQFTLSAEGVNLVITHLYKYRGVDCLKKLEEALLSKNHLY